MTDTTKTNNTPSLAKKIVQGILAFILTIMLNLGLFSFLPLTIILFAIIALPTSLLPKAYADIAKNIIVLYGSGVGVPLLANYFLISHVRKNNDKQILYGVIIGAVMALAFFVLLCIAFSSDSNHMRVGY